MMSRKLAAFCFEALLAVATRFLSGQTRSIDRGDILHVTGSESAVEKLAPIVGRVIHPTEETDFAVLGIAISIGVLVGAVLTNTRRPSENSLGH